MSRKNNSHLHHESYYESILIFVQVLGFGSVSTDKLSLNLNLNQNSYKRYAYFSYSII